jgi:penicillin-binding protein 1A
MAPLDMAAGIQTLANEGLHHDPYFVEFIDGPNGERLFTHLDPGVQVLDREAALTTVDILKGPIYGGGTGRRAAFDDRRPAFGKTGTQDNNTNAWFVGGTRQLSTAVWVGDPNAYTPMARTEAFPGIPEFIADGVPRVQGGFYPAVIWKAFMQPAHAFVPFADWDRPPPKRPNARLVLPGNECVVRQVGTAPAPTAAPAAEPAPVDPNVPPVASPPVAQGARLVGQAPPPVEPVDPVDPVPDATIPVFDVVEVGTTIAPDNLDPLAPLPSVPTTDRVGPCRGGTLVPND